MDTTREMFSDSFFLVFINTPKVGSFTTKEPTFGLQSFEYAEVIPLLVALSYVCFESFRTLSERRPVFPVHDVSSSPTFL